MRRKRVMYTMVLLVVLGSGFVTAANAEDLVAPAAAEKAVRGMANAGLGVVVELPKTVYYDTLEDGPLYGLTVGVLEGLSWGIARTLVGIYEVVTFPFPAPEGYGPILTPAYPYQPGKTDVAD
jgi:putative exosortase-associated protein (TIGR04073 family)